MTAVLLPLTAQPRLSDLEPVLMDAVLAFSAPAHPVQPGEPVPMGHPAELRLAAGTLVFPMEITEEGQYALFTEHHPEEFGAVLAGPEGEKTPVLQKIYKPDHEHDEEVTSVGIDVIGNLDKKRLNGWLSNLLQTQGTDIFRMKGVLSIKGESDRFVFQGVHMLFDGRPDRPWGDHPRRNQLIFIGRNLDRAALTEAFTRCLA